MLVVVLSGEPQQRAKVGRPKTSSSPPHLPPLSVVSLLAVPRRWFFDFICGMFDDKSNINIV